MIATAIATSLVLGQASLPKYSIADGDVWKFTVKAKNEMQPYSTAGALTVSFKQKSDTVLAMLISHDVVMEAQGQSAPSGKQESYWEVSKGLSPTGSGEGMNQFGPELMSILLLPTKATETYMIPIERSVYTTKSVEEKDFIKVTSNVKSPISEHVIERWLDAKTFRLVKGKCVTKSAIGNTTYELNPAK
jgi:hypothetical protein